MERHYINGTFDNNQVKTFVGKEIEHTQAYGKTTLFLATNQLTTEQISDLAKANNCEAIYFGANRMYRHNLYFQVNQIQKLLNEGFYVTVDYPYTMHNAVKQKFMSVWSAEKFIPFCSIIFENSEEDKQLCFKIDDRDFQATNKGVWSTTMEKFKQQAGYTSWEEYKSDAPLEQTSPSKEEETGWTLKTNTVKH